MKEISSGDESKKKKNKLGKNRDKNQNLLFQGDDI